MKNNKIQQSDLERQIQNIKFDNDLEQSIDKCIKKQYNGDLNKKLELKKIVAKLLHL